MLSKPKADDMLRSRGAMRGFPAGGNWCLEGQGSRAVVQGLGSLGSGGVGRTCMSWEADSLDRRCICHWRDM